MAEEKKRYADEASESIVKQMGEEGVKGVWDRSDAMSPRCKFGVQGICCRICYMGPCRIMEGREGKDRGVCGATAATVVARNFARAVAAGTAAHSDHGRGVAETLLQAASGAAKDYAIKDVKKLHAVAETFGIKVDERNPNEIAEELAHLALAEFGKPEGTQRFVTRAPKARQKVWEQAGVTPRAIDREVTELMHRTNMGVDQDFRSILLQATRCSLADGWGGSMIATELQDILFGTPHPLSSTVNLGVLKEDEVNIIIHGHEPILSEMLVVASQDPEMIKKAEKAGAKGITLAGICCTANEVLIRHGIPLAGNFLQQELAIATGAADAMVVDVQCVMQALADLARHYHTKLICTSEKAHITGADRVVFHEDKALDSAKEIIEMAVDNFKNRGKVHIPEQTSPLVAGFSHEAIEYMLGGSFRTSYRPLNDNIMNGRIRGLAGVVGCSNPQVTCDSIQNELVRELIANDILVVQTGCAAIASAKDGLLIPEMKELAGPGLREICETVGIPPVLHSGSCVDNSRILIAATAMVHEGGLGEDISDLPVAGCAPEWMSEKAIAIGQYFVASGVLTVFRDNLPIDGSQEVKDYLYGGIEEDLGGKWAVAKDAKEMGAIIREHIESKRDALGINEVTERKLFDMADRRALEV